MKNVSFVIFRIEFLSTNDLILDNIDLKNKFEYILTKGQSIYIINHTRFRGNNTKRLYYHYYLIESIDGEFEAFTDYLNIHHEEKAGFISLRILNSIFDIPSRFSKTKRLEITKCGQASLFKLTAISDVKITVTLINSLERKRKIKKRFIS